MLFLKRIRISALKHAKKTISEEISDKLVSVLDPLAPEYPNPTPGFKDIIDPIDTIADDANDIALNSDDMEDYNESGNDTDCKLYMFLSLCFLFIYILTCPLCISLCPSKQYNTSLNVPHIV